MKRRHAKSTQRMKIREKKMKGEKPSSLGSLKPERQYAEKKKGERMQKTLGALMRVTRT